MTDRHAGYVVTLSQNIREDDAANLIALLRNIKGVRDVRPVVADPALAVAEARARREMQEKLYAFYCETFAWEVSREGSVD